MAADNQADMLRKIAVDLRVAATSLHVERQEKAAHFINAVKGLSLLRKAVSK